MKVSNLLFFFGYFEGAQTVPVSPVVEVEMARGWRHHAHISTLGTRARVRVQRLAGSADSIASCVGLRATAGAGQTRGVADSVTSARGSSNVSRQGRINATSQARATVLSFSVPSAQLRQALPTSSSSALATSARSGARLGRPNVTIGPDEVAQELEEILFLLEVA